MSIIRNTHFRSAIDLVLSVLVWFGMVTAPAYGQAVRSQLGQATGATDKDVSDAIKQAEPDTSESIYFVDKIVEARAVQAIPMLEAKFRRTQDELDKAHVACALVRLGDKKDVHWDFLVKLATEARFPRFNELRRTGEICAGTLNKA